MNARELSSKDLQMSTRLVESRIEKVAEADKRNGKYIFEIEADTCNESCSTCCFEFCLP